jgi:Zn-dependent protease
MAQDGRVRQSVRLGKYAGVPVGIHWSVAVIFGLVTWELAHLEFPATYAGTTTAYWVAALVTALFFFGSLLAHEVSHAVVARRHGVAVRSITLWLFGGMAELGGEAHTPAADFKIAAAGPGTSFLLVGVFGAVEALMSVAGVHGLVEGVPSWLWKINLLLAAFNLIPAAPLDGGRILRAGLWSRSGDRTRADVIAARVGRAFGIVLVVLGVAFYVGSGDIYALWPAFLGWFLYAAARAEENASLIKRGLRDLRVGEVMTPQPPAIASSTTVAELVHHHLPWYRTDVVAVTGPTGWLEGVLPLERIETLPPLSHADTRIGDLAVPIASAPVARSDQPVQDVLQQMAAGGGVPAVVLDSNNRLAGILTLADIDRTVRLGGIHAGRR